ncbi:MAG: M20/M25/M40 family metallo-hydrolase [Candidatus Aminicenantes bacterium]|nr:M20/M25/M40 family metallo-hydrolase [Candidatus Aminicenantes bacterium]
MPKHGRIAPFLLMSASLLTLLGAQEASSPAASITAAEIKHHIYFLASDALEGRYIASKGYEIAARYGESQFKAAGLKPGLQVDGKPAYLQPVPIQKRTSKDTPILTVKTPKGEIVLTHGRDFKWLEGDILPCQGRTLELVFAGFGIRETAAGWDDFKGLNVEGKLVLIWPGAPLKKGKPVLPEALHKTYSSVLGWSQKLMGLLSLKAAGVIMVTDPSMAALLDKNRTKAESPQIVYDNQAAPAFIPWIITLKSETALAIMAGQAGTPKKPEADAAKIKPGPLKGVTATVAAAFDAEPLPAWNVVGIVEGTDPELKNEYVAVTAHLDHLTPDSTGAIRNGADDNASGCAGVMEIAEAVAAKPLKRSAVFVLFAGEESGLLGSRHFLASCPIPRDKIVADVDLDMIGRTDKANEADRAEYALDTDTVTPEFRKMLIAVNERTVRWPLKLDRLGSAGSDNMTFANFGIPGVFFFSGSHADYHRATDDAEKIDYAKAEAIARLAYELTAELGNVPLPWKK